MTSPGGQALVRAPIDFCFDFSSPCGYLAAQRTEALATKHDRSDQIDRRLATGGF